MSNSTITATPDRYSSFDETPRNSATVFGALIRLYLAKAGIQIPIILVVQVLLAVGMIIGFGFLIPEITVEVATFLTTGVPTTLLLMVGLVLVPQEVAKRRGDGTMTFLRAQPVPRWMLLVADLLVWLVVALPGVAIAIIVGALHFELDLDINWLSLVGVSLLISLMATSVGYAMAVVLPQSQVVVASQVLVFVILLFSPIAFPAQRLPDWFQNIHQWLPLQPAADLMRSALAGSYEFSATQLCVLLGWTGLGIILSMLALVRKR